MDSLLTIFHTENCSTVSFRGYHFPFSEVTARGCTAAYILLKITSFPVRKHGEKKEDTRMEVKLARPKGLLHVLVELQHLGEAGDKVAQGMQPRPERHLFKIDIKPWNCEWEDF